MTFSYCVIFCNTQTAKQGAQTSIHVAVDSEISDVTGQFFCDCKVDKITIKKFFTYLLFHSCCLPFVLQIIKASKLAKDANLAKKVWEISEDCVDLKQEEMNYIEN